MHFLHATGARHHADKVPQSELAFASAPPSLAVRKPLTMRRVRIAAVDVADAAVS